MSEHFLHFNDVPLTRIHKTNERMELAKRQPLPYVLTSRCPECDEEVELDLSVHPLIYPIIGGKQEVFFLHEFIQKNGEIKSHEWSSFVTVNLTLEQA